MTKLQQSKTLTGFYTCPQCGKDKPNSFCVECDTNTNELEKENDKVLEAWGMGGTYLGFNLTHFVKLANQKHILLWGRMLEADKELTTYGKVLVLQDLLEELSK